MIDQDTIIRFMRDRLEGYAVAQFPEFKPARHQQLLSAKLESIERGEIKRLIVTMPPRHGKSRMSSELFPSWFLGRHPDKRVLLLTYGDDLSATFGRSVRNYLRSPVFASLFPECQLSSDSNAVRKFSTTRGGSFNAVGVGGPITGKGADILILDDLIKDREQADSPTYRQSLVDWYKSVARTRLQPDGSIVVVQTRWGTNDFISWLLTESQHEGWHLVSLAALAVENDPLNRAPGQALWPEAYDVQALQQIRETIGSRDFGALYQQCPITDSDIIFRSQWLKFYTRSPLEPSIINIYYDISEPQFEVIASWDLSFGANTQGSSWVVGQCWLYHYKSEICYLIHQVREQMGFVDSVKAITRMYEQFKPTKTLIEAKANGPGTVEVLRDSIPGLTAVEPRGSKQDRAHKVVPLFERGAVMLPEPNLHPWVKPLLNELETFPMGSSDDAVDAMTQALSHLQQRYRSSWLRAYDMRSDNNIFRAMGVL